MATIQPSYKLFIDGEFVGAEGGASLDVFNPATGEKISKIADASKADVDRAVAAARKAFESFRRTSVYERSALLNKIADVLEQNAEFIATVETIDNGKPIRETRAVDVAWSIEHFRYFAGVILGEEGSANMLKERYLSVVLREPIGVVGQIVPWNFPFLMGAWKLAPLLAAGDTCVFKPSSETSLSILEFIRLIAPLLPKGVINVVTGKGSKAGEFVRTHKGLDKLAFTGSTEVGRGIALAAAQKIIPATLELGGKSANIIFDDCDFDVAIDGVQLGILFNQGQVCCAGSRIFVQEGIYNKFVPALVEKFKRIKVGDPLDPNTQMGCQINKKQADKILEYVKIGVEEGAKIAVGGKRHSAGEAFVEPTLLVDVRNDMRVAQEEIFGPVGVVIKFKDQDELVRMANDSLYGLGGAVFTRDIAKALTVARLLETGRVWVNTYNQIHAGAPFGGYKESGIGRETHKMILDHYTQTKNIYIDTISKPSGFYEQ
ncbi:aldehyde dehydrogenase family protein [uncultured Campylobacter sp.]|uniref:aldehyde dehydrogenase family protein n=1 Tax=uncultured Campylobacter sp. TaxID=218934 RepID=UPI00261C1940|nr:aldehyde dehydrogenase family protein [uncultured Campylobacter sp.]